MSAEYKNLMDEEIIVTLVTDEDEEINCLALCNIIMDGQTYISLLPLTEDGEQNPDGDVFFYTYDDAGAEPAIDEIESDETYDAVSDAFDEWLDQMEEQE